MSEFLSMNLHDAELAALGTFRLEVGGEVHEGELDHCWIREGDIEKRFEAGAKWQSDDGRHFDLKLRRLVRHDESSLAIGLGHEFDQVSLRLHDGSGHFELRDRYGAAGLQVHRNRPGSTPSWAQGAGEMPAIHIVPDGATGDLQGEFQVTAKGELHVAEDYGSSEYGTALTGSFILAMHCEASVP